MPFSPLVGRRCREAAEGVGYPSQMLNLLAAVMAVIALADVRAVITPLGAVGQDEIARLKAMGPDAMHHLARIYATSSEDERATLAWIMYSIGTKSPEARAVLLADVHTKNEKLRLQVQWALGRVSDDTE